LLDQIGAPTWAGSLDQATAALMARSGISIEESRARLKKQGGIFHLSNAGETSWFGFAQHILATMPDEQRILESLEAIPSSGYPLPAQRPLNSRLSNQKIQSDWGIFLPSWQEALAMCFT